MMGWLVLAIQVGSGLGVFTAFVYYLSSSIVPSAKLNLNLL